MNILIVDDEKVIREGMVRTIQQHAPSFRLFIAASPEEAVQVLRSHSIDLVMTDILMPGMTGLELMKLFFERTPRMKWVVISAHSEFAYAQEAIRLGAKDYLLKPIGKERIVAVIDRLHGEWQNETALSLDAAELKSSLKYLREAIFQRWASGLDIGCFDMRPLIQRHAAFHLLMVNLNSDRSTHVEHFMVENVLSELIDQHGHGFVVSFDKQNLLGLVTLHSACDMLNLTESIKAQLKRIVKVPYQVLPSAQMSDFGLIPEQLRKLRLTASAHVYEPKEWGGERAIELAVQYMKAHFHEDLSLERMAAYVYLNPVYFSQLFKQKAGQGFKDYLISLRMDQAKLLLSSTGLRLADIAARIGYQDIRHFAQLFRRKFEMTPTEYRQQREQPQINIHNTITDQ
ncbi:response regulator [Paenibacillus sp. ACRRX]|uniref:response regulator n=1 Tax=Paenibacillus sp. ACRRX TaxID=2918206 RepID=UPI001EF5F2F4|nr:response regulator [Paenibacillus sp. ACRRX]MCG7408894.1 response regulator [Paenibacillus sp. ACRRX]